jgi:insertion element IS1 protein InsB
LQTTLLSAQPDDVLELDELWSFVEAKVNAFWVWLAICRRTRQVVGYFLGGREEEDCAGLRAQLAPEYAGGATVSDGLQSYPAVFGDEHRCVGKESGETIHAERFNLTLRQRLARFVRKTLSFSKSPEMHHVHLRLFLHHYNLSCLGSL